MAIRAYLRASTKKQNAERARQSLDEFVGTFGKTIDYYYVENESGTILERSELNRLIADSAKDDILLVEEIDRLSRLTLDEYEILDRRLESKGINMVIMGFSLSHDPLKQEQGKPLDDFTRVIMRMMTKAMIYVQATNARKDYELRRQRQRQGIELVQADPKAKAEKYKGRQANTEQYKNILEFRKIGKSYSEIEKLLGVTRVTISRAIKWGDTQNKPVAEPVKPKRTKKTPVLPPIEPSDVAEVKTDTTIAPKTKRTKKRPTKQNSDSVEKCDKTNDMFK